MRNLLAILMLVALPARAEAPADFAYAAPVEAARQEALLWLELPSAVYEGVVRNDLGDLRIHQPHLYPGLQEAFQQPQSIGHAGGARECERNGADGRVHLTMVSEGGSAVALSALRDWIWASRRSMSVFSVSSSLRLAARAASSRARSASFCRSWATSSHITA